jgi:hypothetical protein
MRKITKREYVLPICLIDKVWIFEPQNITCLIIKIKNKFQIILSYIFDLCEGHTLGTTPMV